MIRFLAPSLLMLPALLFWLAGWAHMELRQPGPHYMEWGYLLALLFFVLVWTAMVVGTLREKYSGTSLASLRWVRMCYLLFLTASIGIAVDSWGADERPLGLLYWVLPLIFMVLFIFWRTRKVVKQEAIASASVTVSYLGLVCYIYAQAAGEVAWMESLTNTRFDVYSLLDESMRSQIRSLIDPAIFIGLFSLSIATIIVAVVASLSLQNKRPRGVASLVFAALLMLLLPMTYVINAVLPYEHSIWSGISLFEFKLISFAILSFLVVLKTSANWFRLGARAKHDFDVESYLLILIASYSLSPITFSVFGNLQTTLFWALLLGALLFQSIAVLSNDRGSYSQYDRLMFPFPAVGVFLFSLPPAAVEVLYENMASRLTPPIRRTLEWVQARSDSIEIVATIFVFAGFAFAVSAARQKRTPA